MTIPTIPEQASAFLSLVPSPSKRSNEEGRTWAEVKAEDEEKKRKRRKQARKLEPMELTQGYWRVLSKA